MILMISRFIESVANKMFIKMFMAVIDLFLEHTPRIKMLHLAFSYALVSNLKGDYLEFGVYKGWTFAQAYHYAQKKRFGKMRFFAFDSFKGLPEKAEEYGLDDHHFHKGQYNCGVGEFSKNIARLGVDLNKVKIIEGWFEESLDDKLKRDLGLKQGAIVVVDCDLYKSTVPVLEFISDLLINGSIIMFDDWFLYEGDPDRGAQRAVKEWLVAHPEIGLTEYHKYGWGGISFIVRRR